MPDATASPETVPTPPESPHTPAVPPPTDKLIQGLQQEQAVLRKQLAEISQKLNSPPPPPDTPTEPEDDLETELAPKLAQTVKSMRDLLTKQELRLKEQESFREQMEKERGWNALRAEFPAIPFTEIRVEWEKAVQEARDAGHESARSISIAATENIRRKLAARTPASGTLPTPPSTARPTVPGVTTPTGVALPKGIGVNPFQ